MCVFVHAMDVCGWPAPSVAHIRCKGLLKYEFRRTDTRSVKYLSNCNFIQH